MFGGGLTYLSLPAVSGAFASTPDDPALEFTGDLELRAVVMPLALTGGGRLICKFNTASNQRSFVMYMPGGVIGATPGANDVLLQISPDGSAQAVGRSTGTGGMPTANGVLVALKSTWRKSDGRFQHFYSFDYNADADSGTWTQQGVDVFDTAAAAGRFDSTAALEMGSSNGGTANLFRGRYYRAQMYNGIGGTKVFDVDYTRQRPGATSITALTGQTVTISGTAAIVSA